MKEKQTPAYYCGLDSQSPKKTHNHFLFTTTFFKKTSKHPFFIPKDNYIFSIFFFLNIFGII